MLWLDGVINEKLELDLRAEKLFAFTNSTEFNRLDETNKGMMEEQLKAMIKYSRLLRDRIMYNEPETSTAKGSHAPEYTVVDEAGFATIKRGTTNLFSEVWSGTTWVQQDSVEGRAIMKECHLS